MNQKYYTVLTTAGVAAMTLAALTGEPAGFTHMAVGDGGGTLPTPTPESTGLVNERYRSPLNRLEIADHQANIIEAEIILPPQIGGFWLREVALFDDAGTCLAIANMPESYKPLLAQGAGRHQIIQMWLAVSSTADIKMIDNPDVVLATTAGLKKVKAESMDYTDEEIGSLESALKVVIAEAIVTARRDFWEEENPLGTVRFFAQKVNPNELYPWSEWAYTGENKTIRVAKADGSNVATTGGNDNATLAKENLPEITLNVSGETGEVGESELETEPAGKHNHINDPIFDKLSARASDLDGDGTPGSVDETNPETEYRVAVMEGKWGNATMIDAEDHRHKVRTPAHSHTIEAKTEELGEGKSFSVVEAHTLLMCWARVA